MTLIVSARFSFLPVLWYSALLYLCSHSANPCVNLLERRQWPLAAGRGRRPVWRPDVSFALAQWPVSSEQIAEGTASTRPTADIRNSNEHRQQSTIVSVSIRNHNSIYFRKCTPPWTEEMANNNQMTISRYTAILAEYDLILNEACGFSRRLTGRKVVEEHLIYAEIIFTKMVCHAISLRRISPTFQTGSNPELWDIGAACSIARTLVESFDALAYIALQPVTDPERKMRILLWELHDKEHRLTMLDGIGAAGPDIDQLRDDAKMLRDAAMAHPFYGKLSKKVQQKITAGEAPAYIRIQSDRNQSSGINHDYYLSVIMQLSQYVHTLPFALSQLRLTHAGDPGALQIMSLPLQYSMPFMAKAIEGMGQLWPALRIKLPEDTQRKMDLWILLAADGVKGAGK